MCGLRASAAARTQRSWAASSRTVPTSSRPSTRRSGSRFRTRAHRDRALRRTRASYRPRRKQSNRRRACARARDFKELRLVRQWIAELPQLDAATGKPYRLVVRRQRIEHHQGQQHLFDEYRYRYIVTDLPVVRWEWKRFRQAYVYAAAQVVRSSRQTIIRLSAAHRWYESLVAAHVWLQT
jgi:hypothetical protein